MKSGEPGTVFYQIPRVTPWGTSVDSEYQKYMKEVEEILFRNLGIPKRLLIQEPEDCGWNQEWTRLDYPQEFPSADARW